MSWWIMEPVAGGIHRCGRWWSAPPRHGDGQLRLYAVLEGSAWVELGGRRCAVVPGRLLLIPGGPTLGRHCPRSVRIAWLHLVPRDPSLVRDCERLSTVVDQPSTDHAAGVDALRRAGGACDPEGHRLPARWPPGLPAVIEGLALALSLIGLGLAATRAAEPEDDHVARALAWCQEHWREQPPLSAIAAASGCSGDHLRRRFRAVIGRSPHAWYRELAMREARRLLADPERTVAEVARSCGFADPLYFSRVCRCHFGRSPSDLRGPSGP